MTLTEFLLARVKNDERMAQEWIDKGEWVRAGRLVMEAKAKRQILERLKWYDAQRDLGDEYRGFDNAMDEAVRILASVYCDHPDYQQEWSP